jgi:hypothetical protein
VPAARDVRLAHPRIDDEGEPDRHSVRVAEPKGLEGADILDAAVARAATHEPAAKLLEAPWRCRGKRKMIDVTALEHQVDRDAVHIVRQLHRMQPRLRAAAQYRVPKRRRVFAVDQLEAENTRVEINEAIEIVRHDHCLAETTDQ